MNPILANMLGPLFEIIGRFFPDPEKKAAAQLQLVQMAQNGDLAELNAALQTILAEANGNWLQRSWRPMMMIFFCGLVGARWFGYSAPNMRPEEIMELWAIVKIGIGGYTIGRTGEKIIPQIVEIMKK
jgi:hypothetical protein